MKSYPSPDVPLYSDESMDPFMEGRLRLIQSKEGYRFSIDALLLSEFVTIRPGDVVADMGAGCGIIPLMLLLTQPVKRVFALEIQNRLASQALRNARLNGFQDKMHVVTGDLRHLPFMAGCASVVVCNPPYRKMRSGRINPDPERAIARHELMLSLDELILASRALLCRRGRFALVYPAVRLAEILVHLRRHNLEPKRLRIHYPNGTSNAKLALIEACLGGNSGVEILPPLLGQGRFSIENPP